MKALILIRILCPTAFLVSNVRPPPTFANSIVKHQALKDHSDIETNPIRVLTWNILAQSYLKAPPSFLFGDLSGDHRWPAYTEWCYRLEKIMDTLSQSKADVVCFQEVEWSVYDGLKERFLEMGYDSHAQDTDESHPVTNVVLISRRLEWNVIFKESRSRALILGIQHENMKVRPFFLVNVHLQASSLDFKHTAQTRFSQLQSLLKRIKLAWNRIRDDYSDKKGITCARWEDQPEIMMMGDFNFSPSDPLYKLLVKGRWPDDRSDYKDQLPSKVSEMTASSLPLLPLRDVKGSLKLSPHSSPWTYAPSHKVYDYIFVSDNVEPVAVQDYLPASLVDALSYSAAAAASSPTDKDRCMEKPLIYWPNKYHPSDHIAVGATVRIRQPHSSSF